MQPPLTTCRRVHVELYDPSRRKRRKDVTSSLRVSVEVLGAGREE